MNAGIVNNVYAAIVGRVSERQDKLKTELDKAQAEWETVRKDPDKELRRRKAAGTQAKPNPLTTTVRSRPGRR